MKYLCAKDASNLMVKRNEKDMYDDKVVTKK